MQHRLYESTAEGLEHFIRDASHILNLTEFGKEKKVKSYKKKSEIFAEGDTPNNVYYVKSGNVKIFKYHPDGKEFITNLVGPNDFFGFEPNK